MSSIESLLKKNFVPTRSVVLTFGFDEEASGFQVSHNKFKIWFEAECDDQGAAYLAKYLESTYGKDAFALLVDEGGMGLHGCLVYDKIGLISIWLLVGFGELFGTVFATPGIAEKGHMDVRVDISSPGGHSRSVFSIDPVDIDSW